MDSQTKDHYFQLGIDAFNEGRYFDAHEEWEQIWLQEKGDDKPFYQGLIQVAAAFHHSSRGKIKPAQNCLQSGVIKLKKFVTKPVYPIDVALLLKQVLNFSEKKPHIKLQHNTITLKNSHSSSS